MCTMCGTAGCQLRNTPIHTPCLRHFDVVFIGQLKLVNSFSNLALLQLFYKYTCIVVSIYLMDHGRQLRNSPLRLDCCTQGLILFARSNTKRANRTPCQAYIRLKVDVMSRFFQFVTSRSNVLDDGELRLRGLTLGDERLFLRDAQRSAVAVKTYGNYEALACET